jgi:predicted ATPase
MLQTLELKSFKGFSDIRIPFQPFTLLVGPNGAGKSTIIQAIDILNGVVTGTLPEYLRRQEWEYADLPYLRSRNSKMEISADIQFNNSVLRWTVGLGTRRYAGISSEKVSQDGQSFLSRIGRQMNRLDEETNKEEQINQTLTSSWLASLDLRADAKRFPTLVKLAAWARAIHGYFFLNPVALRSQARGSPSDVGKHGGDLAPFLHRLRSRDRNAFERIVERVRKYYTSLVDIVPRRSQFGWTRIEIREHWNGEVVTFTAQQVSDGLLRLVTISAMQELDPKPSLILLDEIENGLHPHLLGQLMMSLQNIAKESNIQVIATTHSPIAVNFCESPNGVALLTRSKSGKVKVRTLDQVRGFDRLHQVFDPGELWYNLGEERLLR